jgi:hypothetical protein
MVVQQKKAPHVSLDGKCAHAAACGVCVLCVLEKLLMDVSDDPLLARKRRAFSNLKATALPFC